MALESKIRAAMSEIVLEIIFWLDQEFRTLIRSLRLPLECVQGQNQIAATN